jgi:UDP-N-acetylglucosamine--N-acetylmuramyl-(pentapeptide) pyrophosphoryl-undecaprenol N-acetylglucosamine transferase
MTKKSVPHFSVNGERGNMPITKTVCWVAGRSGGHILPALTLAQQHKQAHPQDTVLFFSTDTNLDTAITKAERTVDSYIPLTLDNVPKSLFGYPYFMLKAGRAFIKSLYYLRCHRPQSVMSMGGYISIPVCLAARLLRIPVDIFELNAVPGRATKFLARYARTVFICFVDSARHLPQAHCVVAPYPLRFTQVHRQRTQQEARTLAHLSVTKRTLFVLGGSQGSLFINNLVKSWIEHNPQLHDTIQVIHQTGAQDATDWVTFYAQHNIPARVFAYHASLDDYYLASDLIICRSGAGTLHEILFFGKRCITIPLETASTDHQIDNATSMAQQYPELFTVVYQKEVIHEQKKVFESITQHLEHAASLIQSHHPTVTTALGHTTNL